MDPYETQSEFLKAISHPTRLAILDILRGGEQCDCHMEATLNLRQAYISQQLMTLKDAGLVESRRDGLNLYYRVTKPEILNVIDTLSSVTGVTTHLPEHKHADMECPCPKCNVKAVIGPLVEVPVMIGLVNVAFWLQRKLYKSPQPSPA